MDRQHGCPACHSAKYRRHVIQHAVCRLGPGPMLYDHTAGKLCGSPIQQPDPGTKRLAEPATQPPPGRSRGAARLRHGPTQSDDPCRQQDGPSLSAGARGRLSSKHRCGKCRQGLFFAPAGDTSVAGIGLASGQYLAAASAGIRHWPGRRGGWIDGLLGCRLRGAALRPRHRHNGGVGQVGLLNCNRASRAYSPFCATSSSCLPCATIRP